MSRRHAASAHTTVSQSLHRTVRRGPDFHGPSGRVQQRHPAANQRPDKQQWAKIWFGKMAKFHRAEDPLSWQFTRERVIEFLRSEKAKGAPTWKRLKIVQSLMLYCQQTDGWGQPDLGDIRLVLYGQVQKERMSAGSENS